MARVVSIALLFLALTGQIIAQEVFIARDSSAGPAATARKEVTVAETPKEKIAQAEPAKPPLARAEPIKPQVAKAEPVKPPIAKAIAVSAPVKEHKEPAKIAAATPQPEKAKPIVAEKIKAQPLKVAMVNAQDLTQPSQRLSGSADTAFTRLADGFDFPIGKPDAQGYYKARGFRSKGHLGEDWDGVGGGDTDKGDPIYSIGDGIVVFARDCHMGWGNVIIVRHTYREGGEIKSIDALYGHLNTMSVKRGQSIARGQQIATMGTAHGLYDAHLHLEIRRNLEIGMSRAKFARDFSNYYDPTLFIQGHRHLQTSDGRYKIAMNTFTYDSKINWSKKRNYSSYRGGSSESATALKKAVASQGR